MTYGKRRASNEAKSLYSTNKVEKIVESGQSVVDFVAWCDLEGRELERLHLFAAFGGRRHLNAAVDLGVRRRARVVDRGEGRLYGRSRCRGRRERAAYGLFGQESHQCHCLAYLKF
jgi:hypothetical protein